MFCHHSEEQRKIIRQRKWFALFKKKEIIISTRTSGVNFSVEALFYQKINKTPFVQYVRISESICQKIVKYSHKAPSNPYQMKSPYLLQFSSKLPSFLVSSGVSSISLPPQGNTSTTLFQRTARRDFIHCYFAVRNNSFLAEFRLSHP